MGNDHRARDLLTPFGAEEARVLATGQFRIMASPIREILSIAASTDHPRLQEMVGVRAGGASRAALAEKLGDLRGTPLYQLLDDYAGASLVAGWIWSRWSDDWMIRAQRSGTRSTAGKGGVMTTFAPALPKGPNFCFTRTAPATRSTSPMPRSVLWNTLTTRSAGTPCRSSRGPQKAVRGESTCGARTGWIKVDAGFP